MHSSQHLQPFSMVQQTEMLKWLYMCLKLLKSVRQTFLAVDFKRHWHSVAFHTLGAKSTLMIPVHALQI